MSVCSLQLAAAHSIIISTCKHLNVFQVIAKAAFKITLHGTPHLWTKIALEHAEDVTFKLVDKIPNINLIPLALRARLAVITFELGCQCIHFFEGFAKNMKPKCEADILLCASNMIITQNFEINRQATILKFLLLSKMSVTFESTFLLNQCIEKHAVEYIANKVLTLEARKRKTRHNDKSYKEIKKQINVALKSYNSHTIKTYIEMCYSVRRICHPWLKVVIFLIADYERLPLMKYYFDSLGLEEKKQRALEGINFILEELSDLPPDVIMYLSNFIDDCDWSAIIEQYALQLIQAFLPSWRYRHLCVEWFKIAVTKFDLETYRNFITFHLPVNKTWGSYETYELKQILRYIWLATPQQFKDDPTVQGVIEQFVIIIWGDYELYSSMISNFDREKQKDLLASAALLSLNTHPDIVPLLMNRIRELGFEFTSNDDVVSMTELIIFICRKNIACPKKESYTKLFYELDKFYFNSPSGADMFKDFYLSERTDLLEILLIYRWSSKLLMEFLKWFHNGSTVRVKRFVAEMVSDGVIQRIYEKLLIQNGKTKKADEGLCILQIHKTKRDAMKKMTLSKPKVRTSIMIRHFKNKEATISEFESEWEILLEDYEKEYKEKESIVEEDDESLNSMSSYDHRYSDSSSRIDYEKWQLKFYEDLLVSDECLEALIHIIVNVKREPNIKKYQDLLENYYMLRDLFKEYKLSLKIDNLLEKHGHPNNSDTLYYGCEEASGANLPLVRKVVDFSYRSLRAILRGAEGGFYYSEMFFRHSDIDLTEISIDRAEEANIDVPVVL